MPKTVPSEPLLIGELMTTAEVAERAGVHIRTVHRWVRSGRLSPAMKGPGSTGPMFFRRGDVEALARAA